MERDGVERDGVERDGLERDGLERDGVERDGVERDGVERVEVSLTVYRNLIPVKGVGASGLEKGGFNGDSNSNGTVVGFQRGRRIEIRWGTGCLVVWLGIVVAAL